MLTGLTFSMIYLFIYLSLKFSKTWKKEKKNSRSGDSFFFFGLCDSKGEHMGQKKKRRDVDRSKGVGKSATFHFHFAKQLKRLVCCLYLKIKSKNSSSK